MNILIVGKGKMGQLIDVKAKALGLTSFGCCDVLDPSLLQQKKEDIDVILDFSHPDNLMWILKEIEGTSIALVEGTTGLQEEQLEALKAASKNNPIFYATNYSYGIALFHKLLKEVVPLLKDSFDIEIVETHHNQKVDAPSGTALSLLESIDPDHEFEHVFGRQGNVGARCKKEIGIHALRGGTIAGIHEVDFFGEDEVLEIKHTATSRQIFVNGAIKAALFIANEPNGLYSMDDLLKGELHGRS